MIYFLLLLYAITMIYLTYLAITEPTFWIFLVMVIFTLTLPWSYFGPPELAQRQLVITEKEIKVIPPYLRLYWWVKPSIIPRWKIDQYNANKDGMITFYFKGEKVESFKIFGRKGRRKSEVERISKVLDQIGLKEILSSKYLNRS